MSKNLNNIVKSIFKLSDIFYNLSAAKVIFAADEDTKLLIKLNEDKIFQRFIQISENIQSCIRAIGQVCDKNEKISEQYYDIHEEIIIPLLKVYRAANKIIENKEGIIEYTKYLKELKDACEEDDDNRIVQGFIVPLIENIKYIYIQELIHLI
jgi:uncharacterized coiled-coil DUF342 family protein